MAQKRYSNRTNADRAEKQCSNFDSLPLSPSVWPSNRYLNGCSLFSFGVSHLWPMSTVQWCVFRHVQSRERRHTKNSSNRTQSNRTLNSHLKDETICSGGKRDTQPLTATHFRYITVSETRQADTAQMHFMIGHATSFKIQCENTLNCFRYGKKRKFPFAAQKMWSSRTGPNAKAGPKSS